MALLWPAQPAIGQLPELPPEVRFRTAVADAFRGDDGAAITHLLLLAGRHPSHPLTPWARLGAAALYERKGDFIAAIVQFRQAEPLFVQAAAVRLREHRQQLELELSRTPVQIMRLGRHLLATAAPTDEWSRLATWFAVRFRPSPLTARIKLQLAAFRLREGRRFEAMTLLLWAARDPGPRTRRTAAEVLGRWRAPSPLAPRLMWISLILAGIWSLIRLWQLGPVGPTRWFAVSAVGGALSLFVPTGFVFFPFFFLLAGLVLWTYGFPRRLGTAQTAGLALTVLWITTCSLIVAGRFPF
ncbi:MAG: hypothetical protein CVU59_04840 [Deltaproteobacteria bacterium HGW-Deltaproteobacteria-17]|nr:MAG: hypothetical protein CVU59_04840 [Deltaproteobacteria bacterium HGW-Deltaproteobacteria-17]